MALAPVIQVDQAMPLAPVIQADPEIPVGPSTVHKTTADPLKLVNANELWCVLLIPVGYQIHATVRRAKSV